MKNLKIDEEFKNLIPALTQEEYKLLEESVLEEGLRDPIVAWDKTVIDGHNRYEICQKHDIEIAFNEKIFQSRNEAMIWIIDNQKGRRNLTMQQKLEIGFKRAELLKPKAEENQKSGLKQYQDSTVFQKSEKREPINTTAEAAKYAGVSTDTASKYKKIQESDNEEVKEKVRSGELSINKGYKEVKPRKEPEKEKREVPAFVDIQEELEQEEDKNKKQGKEIALSIIKHIENEIKYAQPHIKNIVFDHLSQWIEENI